MTCRLHPEYKICLPMTPQEGKILLDWLKNTRDFDDTSRAPEDLDGVVQLLTNELYEAAPELLDAPAPLTDGGDPEGL